MYPVLGVMGQASKANHSYATRTEENDGQEPFRFHDVKAFQKYASKWRQGMCVSKKCHHLATLKYHNLDI